MAVLLTVLPLTPSGICTLNSRCNNAVHTQVLV